MTSELSMLHDRLSEIIKAMTMNGAIVENDGVTMPPELCLEMAQPLTKVMHEMNNILCTRSLKQ